MLRDMSQRDVVLLGEQHDSADHHRWQLQTLAALHLMRPDMAIGFEAFPRRVQPVLDAWVEGGLTTSTFLERVEWKKVWNMPPELYMPLFEFARMNRIPMIALNVERTLTRAVRQKGFDAVPAEQREGVSRPAAAPAEYERYLRDIFERHVKEGVFAQFVEAQTTWDRAFAEALAAPLAKDAARPLVVGIVGQGHLRHGHGVPHQLRDIGVTRVGTLLPVDAAAPCGDLPPGLADAIFAIPAAAKN